MPSKTVHCGICGEAIRGDDFGERMRKLRKHRKAEHPKAHKKSVKKTLKTKRRKGIINTTKRRAKQTVLKIRRDFISRPAVVRYGDFEGNDSMIRLLLRSDDSTFPEFALYTDRYRPKFDKKVMGQALRDAKFTEEARGKWVLRTNKFSIFVYV